VGRFSSLFKSGGLAAAGGRPGLPGGENELALSTARLPRVRGWLGSSAMPWPSSAPLRGSPRSALTGLRLTAPVRLS
jgi:hypothetical protein